MHRKKRSFFHSILFRSSLWIVLPGIAGMFLVAYFVGIQMRYQIEKQITEEMQRVRDNSLLYVQQTLLLNDSRMDAVSFQLYKNEIEEQLRKMGLANPIEFFNDEYMPSFYFDRLEERG